MQRVNGPLDFDPIAEAQRQWVDRGWAQAADGMAAVTSVMRVHQILLARVDAVLRRHELTFARYELLMLLLFSRKESLPLSKAGSRLQVHPTTITNSVDRLEAQKLARRVEHPTDGRITLVELTAAGRELALRATEDLNPVFAALGLDAAKTGALIELLTQLRGDAGDFVRP
jgi:DNA-binding MarR family transcriptional regulator